MSAELLAFEDLRIGDEWVSATHQLSSSEIREFADLTGDYNRIHLDEEFAKSTPFGKPIAHGLLGLSLMAGLSTIAPAVRTTALLSIHGWRFRKPVFVGDTIRVVTQVAEIREHGRRHGEVHWYQRLVNQKDEVVQDGMLTTLVERRVKIGAKSRDLVRIDAAANVSPPHIEESSPAKTVPSASSQSP
jgi:3-hydroxybutyryl-CoA dehydratase